MAPSRRREPPSARTQALLLTTLLSAVLQSACQTQAPAPQAIDPAVVQALVRKGDQARAAGHWDTPPSNSARDYYQRALALAPADLEARRGLEQVTERYLRAARQAADRQSHQQAQALWEQAQASDSEHPGVLPTQRYLALLRDSDRQVLTIEHPALERRDPELVRSLRRLGEQARASNCRTLITTRSDPDYRWIYQRLTEAPGQVRIRAQFDIGAPSRVTVLCKQ